ncbi:MAG: sensor histidine kinase [Propionibacteriaceae bacterium]
MRSLLVRYGLAVTSIVLIAFLVPLGIMAQSLTEERALAAGRQDAQQVALFVGDTQRLVATLTDVNSGERRTTVFTPSGQTLGEPAPLTASVQLARTGRAFTATTTGGAEVLVPVAGAGGTTVVSTFVPDSQLHAGLLRAWLTLAGVGVALLLVTALAGHRIASGLSRSVSDLADVAQRLGAGELTARVEPSGPAEVRSVGTVLNELGEQVDNLLADERELVADLSHRLRTPITALRLDAETLADPEERERMGAHVAELVAAVDTVIEAARSHRRRAPVRSDAAQVVRDRAKFWSVLAASQGRPFSLDVCDSSAVVAVGAEELGAGLDVVLDNVFKHTEPGSPLSMSVTADSDTVRVVVADAGPGMPDVKLASRGRSGTGSTGLGMDVARRTAERAGGDLELGPGLDGRGLSVTLRLPSALAKL